jgi:hypothetical protein
VYQQVDQIHSLAIGRYSWRAMKRMEDEWEDYQWLLQEYKKKNGPVLDKSPDPDGTIAIDLGTIHLKMAHANPKSVVVANRTGGQYTFAGVVQTDNKVLLGQQALDRFYQSPPITTNHHLLAMQNCRIEMRRQFPGDFQTSIAQLVVAKECLPDPIHFDHSPHC